MIVAGIGCRKGAVAEAVSEAIAAALEEHGLEPSSIDALATACAKGDEPGIVTAARLLGVPLICVPESDMKLAQGRAATWSARVLALKGVPSVAETAALAAAGRSSRLLAPRIAKPTVTCAIAFGEGP
jgi:cobalt-precorrin 5A hydrolase